MDYFLLRQLKILDLKKEMEEDKEATICRIEEVRLLKEFDYISRNHLVSDRMKQLLESYLPFQDFKPYVFIDKKLGQEVFWYLNPVEYKGNGETIDWQGRGDGAAFDCADAPKLFKVYSEQRTELLLVHLSIVESILRRGYLGLTFMRI